MANSEDYEGTIYRVMGRVNMESSDNVKHALNIQASSCTLGHFSRRNKDLWSHRNLHMNIHRRCIPRGQSKTEKGRELTWDQGAGGK